MALEFDRPNLTVQERALTIRQEELSLLNDLRLEKHTENSNVAVAIFPRLPLKPNSMDRIVLSYSISTYAINRLTADDFRVWWKEIQRVLKPGGKAYIFPMQLEFRHGRMYDKPSLEDTLDEFTPLNNGQLVWEFYENPNEDSWRQDTTLIITKALDHQRS